MAHEVARLRDQLVQAVVVNLSVVAVRVPGVLPEVTDTGKRVVIANIRFAGGTYQL